MLRLHDTAAGQVRELATREPGKVSMYVCGPTVYGPPHLGHGRFSLVWDVVRRYLAWSGLDVTYVSNITDVDDKIIERAVREGRSADEVAQRCEAVWYRAMDAIGVQRPTEDPHATAWIAQMVELIEDLVARGVAYQAEDGVYFSVESVPDYGLLARQRLEDLREGGGEREVVGETKRHPADFALWKLAKPDEPSWPSPWGDGRPGWHTECVVMSLGLLGDGFDLHAGGLDLAFPHHENERAQAVASDRAFAQHWAHNGFVVDASGEKMSKSLGNFTNLLDLVDAGHGRAYRLLVLQSHYRAPLVVNADTLAQAEAALARLDAFAARSASLAAAEPSADVLGRFRQRMDDDVDTPGAMALVFDQVRQGNSALDRGDEAVAAGAWATVREITGALGLELRGEEPVPEDVAARAAERDEARKAKDFARSDALRAELQALGWVVEDTPQGTRVRRGAGDQSA